jgi:hypothetical protein
MLGVCAREIRIELHCSFERVQRALMISLKTTDQPVHEVRHGDGRINPQCLL